MAQVERFVAFVHAMKIFHAIDENNSFCESPRRG
jgi:hypothetical protein